MTRRNVLRLFFAVPAAKLLGAGVPGFGAVTPFDDRATIRLHAVRITVAGDNALISVLQDGKPVSSFFHANYAPDVKVIHTLALPPMRAVSMSVQVMIETLNDKPFTLFDFSVLRGPERRQQISEFDGLSGLWERRRQERSVIDLQPRPG